MLELKQVSFRIQETETPIEIVDNVSFTLEDGRFLVITGPNGGGKSTLAKLIMGIEQPTSGQILLDGQDITHLSVTQRAKLGVGYAFQQPPRFKGLTVYRLLCLANGGELTEEDCFAYLTSVGLCPKDYLYREVDASLSGGEMKRIEIASLMARKTKLAIYDEPEAGIDLWSFAMLVDSFKAISSRHHESIILISHQERIMQLADEVLVLAAGKVVERGARDEVLPRLTGEFACDCAFKKEGRAMA